MTSKPFPRRQKRLLAIAFAAACGLPGAAGATNVLPGLDYFHTLEGTFFDFTAQSGGQVGIVNFVGLDLTAPFDTTNFGTIDPTMADLGDSDTVVERLAEAALPNVGDSATIPIEMVALSLQSAMPVMVGGSFFDVFVTLDPNMPSLGTMTINHAVADNGTDAPEGTFDSLINLFLDATFVEVGGTGANDFVIDLNGLSLQGLGIPWTHELTGKPQFPFEGPNFFLASPTGNELHLPPNDGRHRFRIANGIPEPGTWALLGFGFALLGLGRRRQPI